MITGRVAELVDALRSGRSSRKGLRVQISPRPQNLCKITKNILRIKR